MKATRLRGAIVAAFLFAGCGTAPKPAELVSFEQLRSEGYAETVRERHPDLYKEAEKHYRDAIEAHEDGESDLTLHHTRLASITWRTAVALSQKKDAEDSLRAADNRRKLAEDDLARTRLMIEKAEAMARMQAMQRQLADAQAKATQEKRAAEAKSKLDNIAKKLGDAEGMDAARHAPGPLNKAQASFKLALEAFQKGDFAAADQQAAVALADADAVVAATKPAFDAEEQARQVDARYRTLLQASSGLPDTDGRITQRGFVLSVRELFDGGKTSIRPDKAFALDQVAQLVSTYGEFKILVEGHTDNRGRADSNLVLSQARAQAVLAYLTGKGVQADRVNAVGKGDSEPIADNSTRDGRAQNRRVDVIFVRPQAAAPAASAAN